jgi:hypothetical protein
MNALFEHFLLYYAMPATQYYEFRNKSNCYDIEPVHKRYRVNVPIVGSQFEKVLKDT